MLTLEALSPAAFILGDTFGVVTRFFSLFLAASALILGVVFVAFLPADGRLPLGEGLTFVGFLVTAASFFANAGKPAADEGGSTRIVYVDRPPDASAETK